MVTATLLEPVTSATDRPSADSLVSEVRHGRTRSRTGRGDQPAAVRARAVAARPIEYVRGDWTRLDGPLPSICECPEPRRMSAAEEAVLFRRMNFLKHRADQLREWLHDDEVAGATLGTMDRLLDQATKIRNYLVQVFTKLATGVARQYVNTEFRLDELLSEAHVTLLRAVELFDIERGFRFSTYATNAIRHNLNRYVTRQHRLRQTTRDYLPADGIAVEPTACPHRREREYLARMERIVRWIRQLDPREQKILKNRYGLASEPRPVTLQSLADQMGLSRERVRQLEHRAIEKLRLLAETDSACCDA